MIHIGSGFLYIINLRTWNSKKKPWFASHVTDLVVLHWTKSLRSFLPLPNSCRGSSLLSLCFTIKSWSVENFVKRERWRGPVDYSMSISFAITFRCMVELVSLSIQLNLHHWYVSMSVKLVRSSGFLYRFISGLGSYNQSVRFCEAKTSPLAFVLDLELSDPLLLPKMITEHVTRKGGNGQKLSLIYAGLYVNNSNILYCTQNGQIHFWMDFFRINTH